MKNRIIFLVALVVLAVLIGVFLFVYKETDLLQGRIFSPSRQLPAYDESKCYDSDGGKNYEKSGTIYGKMSVSESGSKTDVCTTRSKVREYYCKDSFVQSEEVACENGCYRGACKKKTLINGKVDTLIIVNSDDYSVNSDEINEIFDIANTLWLEPKTGFEFNILDLKIVSFSQLQLDAEDPYTDYLTNKYFTDTTSGTILPEYIVFFDENDVSISFGGHTYYYGYDFLVDNLCTEFPVLKTKDNVKFLASGAIIDLDHRFGRCGYDNTGDNIISEVSINGQCKNQIGLECVVRDGYQICPNLIDTFFVKNPNYFTAYQIVHEFLHSYAIEGLEVQHYTNICLEKLGYDISEYSMEEYSAAFTNPPFDSIDQEYAGICNYVWQQFKNTKQSCN